MQKLSRLKFWPAKPTVAVIRLQGVIGDVGHLRKGLRARSLEPLFKGAFSLRGLKAVIIEVNSPGGSPVQAGLIAESIKRLSKEKKVPVYAVCEDVAASGGYWLACAAEEIYADANSIIGSIGVISAGFGFPELLKRWGIERRVYSAGEKKSMLDPFRAEDESDVAHLTEIQRDIHESFKILVRESRGERLKGDEETLFSGAFWSGRKALELGLVDGYSSLGQLVEKKFGPKVKIKRFDQPKFRFWKPRLGIGQSGAALGSDRMEPDHWMSALAGALEERLFWSRFGL